MSPKDVDHDARREELLESVWRVVARDGLEGALVDLETGAPRAARITVGAMLTVLEPVAEAIGSRNELLAAWTLLGENGAERQRRLAADLGLDGVVRRLADDTEQGVTAVPSLSVWDRGAR